MAATPLNALHSFLAVARRQSFVQAAKDLGVSSSAVSQAVQQLEARVGMALLVRTSRRVSLTAEGQRLVDSAGPAVDQAIEAVRTLGIPEGQLGGSLRLSVPGAAVPLVMTKLVPRFLDENPTVVVDVRVESRFVDIVAEKLDAGVRLIEAIDRDMIQVRLSPPARLVVAAAPSYLKRRGIPQRPDELAKHDCLCFRMKPDAEPWAWELARGKKTWRIPVRGPVIANDRELLQSLALDGYGLLYGLESLIAEHVARGRLRVVLEPYAITVPGLFLYYPNRAQVSPALRAFVALARAQTVDAAPKRK